MIDPKQPNPADEPDANPSESPSLDDLDSLLAAAANLASELSAELGTTDAVSPEPTPPIHALEAHSPSDAEPEPILPSAAQPDARMDDRTPQTFLDDSSDAISRLDEQLAGLQELANSATVDIGSVESVSGDTQILNALQSSIEAPTEPPALSKTDRAFLGDLDDLTIPNESSMLDPFGAPPPRGTGPLSVSPPPPKTNASPVSPPSSTGPTSTPQAPAVGSTGLEDLLGSNPDSTVSAAAHQPGPVESAHDSSRKTRPRDTIGDATTPDDHETPGVTPGSSTTAGWPTRVVAALFGVLDRPFRRVPAGVKSFCGWVALAMLVAAIALQCRALLHGPEDTAHEPGPDRHGSSTLSAQADGQAEASLSSQANAPHTPQDAPHDQTRSLSTPASRHGH